MKLINDLKLVCKLALEYMNVRANLNGSGQSLYSLEYLQKEGRNFYTGCHLKIKITPTGDYYKVEKYFSDDYETSTDAKWLAYRSWSMPNALDEIGGHRTCFFDSSNDTMFLENFDSDKGYKSVEVYKRMFL